MMIPDLRDGRRQRAGFRFLPSMIPDDRGGSCSVIVDDTGLMPEHCGHAAAFACVDHPGLLICLEHQAMHPQVFAITRRGTTTLHGQPRKDAA